MQIEIGVAGDVQVSRKILRVGERANRAQPAFEAIADKLYDWEGDQFATEGRFASGGWAPLAPSTLAAKTTNQILVESGALQRSLTQRGGENLLIVHDDWMAFGTSDPKARFHQRGTDRMPRRRPLELTEFMRRTIVRVLQLWIVRGEITGRSAFDRAAGPLA